jgi:hypothetical protein
MPLDYLPYNLYQFETIVELPPALLVRVIMHELCLFHLHLLPRRSQAHADELFVCSLWFDDSYLIEFSSTSLSLIHHT